jgi:hypothetical protein
MSSWRRQGFANRLRPELGQDRAQRAHARREWVPIVLDDFLKLIGESGRFLASQVGSGSPDAKGSH